MADDGGETTKTLWEQSPVGEKVYERNYGTPGTVGYKSIHGIKGTDEWTDAISKIKSASALASNKAISGLTGTNSGFVDPMALTGIKAKMGAAEVSAMSGLERLNMKIMSDNKNIMAEMRRQRRKGVFNTIVSMATMGIMARILKSPVAAQIGTKALDFGGDIQDMDYNMNLGDSGFGYNPETPSPDSYFI